MKFTEYLNESIILTESQYNELQKIRQDLTKISSRLSSISNGSDKKLNSIAKEFEKQIDDIRNKIMKVEE